MEPYLQRWEEFKLNEAMAGLSKKERERVKRARATSEKVRRVSGMPDETYPGQKDLTSMAVGIMEEEEELLELNPAHDKHTGRFPKGGGKKGDSYSLSGPAVSKAGIDPKYAKKGIFTGNKDKEGNRKLRLKYNMAGDCGRKSVDGNTIPKKKMCSRYPRPYSEAVEGSTQHPGATDNSREETADRYARETIGNALESLKKRIEELDSKQLHQEDQSPCRVAGCQTYAQFLKAIDKLQVALAGKLEAPKKG